MHENLESDVDHISNKSMLRANVISPNDLDLNKCVKNSHHASLFNFDFVRGKHVGEVLVVHVLDPKLFRSIRTFTILLQAPPLVLGPPDADTNDTSSHMGP